VTPRAASDGHHSAIRALVTTRNSLVRSRTAQINGLKAAVMAAPETLIAELEGLSTVTLVKRCARLRPSPAAGPCWASPVTVEGF
jgi:hypothetical protein